MTVLREPVSLTRSAYNHHTNEMLRVGKPQLSTENFFRTRSDNLMCRTLIESWPSLNKNPNGSLYEQAVSILDHFGFIFLTPHIDEDIIEFGALLGKRKNSVERKRVAESKHKLDVSDEEIIARNQHDYALYQTMKKRRDESREGYLLQEIYTEIPFSYPKNINNEEEYQLSAYKELADVLSDQLQGECALMQLKKDKSQANKYINARVFRPILQSSWQEKSNLLTSEQKRMTAELTQHWLRYNRLPHPIYMQLVRCKRLVWGLGRRIKAQVLRNA